MEFENEEEYLNETDGELSRSQNETESMDFSENGMQTSTSLLGVTKNSTIATYTTTASIRETPYDTTIVPRIQTISIPDQLYLEALPSSNIPPHQSVFVNDPKLTDLKQLLAGAGYHAEFNSGVLYVNGVVSVRRNEAGRFNVEGYACEDYYRIRDIVYAQFAIV